MLVAVETAGGEAKACLLTRSIGAREQRPRRTRGAFPWIAQDYGVQRGCKAAVSVNSVSTCEEDQATRQLARCVLRGSGLQKELRGGAVTRHGTEEACLRRRTLSRMFEGLRSP